MALLLTQAELRAGVAGEVPCVQGLGRDTQHLVQVGIKGPGLPAALLSVRRGAGGHGGWTPT